MSAVVTLIEGAVSLAVKRLAGAAIGQLTERLKDSKAKKELAEIIERATEDAIEIAPFLADDLRSSAFLNEVLAPMVLSFLVDPTSELNESDIGDKYIEMFVVPFLRGRSPDETLSKIFRTERVTLHRAFEKLLKAMRPKFYASRYWKEEIRDQTAEKTLSTVLQIAKHIAPVLPVDLNELDMARRDAETGSEALKSWTRTIGGQHIERPELAQLVQRVRDHPFGSTLMIGEAGSGKSALFAELASDLQNQGMVVFAIKADLLPTSVRTLADVSAALGLRGQILQEIEALARVAPVVVLIDQLDAVSEVMDRSSERMRLLLQLANHFREQKRVEKQVPPVHVLVSSRQFEADYDARFQSLEATTVKLALPAYEQVEDLLRNLNISFNDVPVALRDTLRRPFALRLFVDVLRRGVSVRELIASELLNTWLTSADFGDSTSRRETLRFLEKLAIDMTKSESLWRPADGYEVESPQAVRVTMACGIVVRQGGLLGFSHQAWLDDFQAKGFSTGQALAEYAWQRQDGLFARATVLRALQRLRALDSNAYAAAIDALLGKNTTRRHLRHLVVDLMAGQQEPHERERGWILKIVWSDVALARRALARATSHWAAWRSHLRVLTAHVMGNEKLRWSAVQLLIAEAHFDANFVMESMARYWEGEDRDHDVLQVFWKAEQWSPGIAARLGVIFQRQKIDSYVIVSYAETLPVDFAADLLRLYLNGVDFKKNERLTFHGLSKVTEKSSLAFTHVLLPWFVRLASLETDGSPSLRDVYPSSQSLPHFWDDEHFGDGLFGIIKSTVIACAKEHPAEFLALCQPLFSVEVEEVQALIAEALAAGGAALTETGVEFLLADERRLQVGMAHVSDINNVTHLVIGWSSQLLLSAIASDATMVQLEGIRERIERWDPYKDDAQREDDARTRLQRLGWVEEKKFPLLEKLPVHLLSPRRYRQIKEWRAVQPILKKHGGDRLLSAVESPMSAEQMVKASDDELFKMLDEVPNGTERWSNSGRSNRDGGTVELGRAFAAFGKVNSDRALLIAAKRFIPGRHENAAGELIRALSEDKGTDTQQLLSLIRKWNDDGFSSEEWRRDAAWAMQSLAAHNDGLRDSDIELLDSWIVDDPQLTSNRIKKRVEREERNRQMNSDRKSEVRALVFRSGLGGMRMLPQDNFTLLSAMAAGLLNRKPPDWNGWLSALERHVERSEDTAIWTALLLFRGQALYWADRQRVTTLLERIWERFPKAFSDWHVAEYLWAHREMVPNSMLQAIRMAWLASENPANRQAAGELLMSKVLVDANDQESALELERILSGPPSPERLGAIFTASAAWHEDDPAFRKEAHQTLMRFVGAASGDEVNPIARAIDYSDSLIGDELTLQLLAAVGENPEVLRLCLSRNFAKSLQELLLSPGFDESILRLSHRCADLMFADEDRTVRLPMGENFVAIAVALQRSSEPIRSFAMDLYERLLDGAAYGAEEAAEASLQRVA